jgi:acetylornithine deacetylase/succinyl-diaminopimelate desuccinylase-like protein
MPIRWCIAALVSVALVATAPPAQAQQVDFDALGDEAIEYLQQYLRINTINPPGNESRGVEFFARIFDAEGISYESAESAPGRGNIWATLEGGAEPALILIHHIDVVPADERYWDDDPLSGKLDNEHIYGRGALDTKTGGIIHLQTFLALHRAGIALDRDVIFMATADEEAGGFFGAGWLVENRPEIFENVGFLLNEGGGGSLMDGQVSFGVEVTQKVPWWFRLVATGEPGHGSRPLKQSSVTRLVAALEKVRTHDFEHRLVPAVEAFFTGLAANAAPPWDRAFVDMDATLANPTLMSQLHDDNPGLHALTRNTCSMTILEGSGKINVVPPQASAELDCRLLPDQDPEAFIAELRATIDDESVQIERIMGFTPAVSSTDTELYRSIQGVLGGEFPDAPIVPSVVGGFTDSHFFRDLGITSYGFFPTVTPVEDAGGVHGNNERVSVENVRRGTRLMFEIVRRFVDGRAAS